MQNTMLEIINQFGYIGIFLLVAIENIFPPIPSEIVLTFAGFLTTQTQMNVWLVIVAATAGSVAGAVVLYLVGRLFTPERLERLFDGKLGRILHLKASDVSKAEKWFLKREKTAVFVCRFIPVVRSLISIPAGAAKMHWGAFLSLSAAGTFAWNTLLIFLGRFAGDAWESMVSYVDIYATIAIIILIVAVVILGVIFVKKRFLK